MAEARRKDPYDVALSSLSEFGAPVFPWHVFILNGAKALISADEGDLEGAKRSAQIALAAAAVTDPGLGWGREAVGLVRPRERDSELFQRLRNLA